MLSEKQLLSIKKYIEDNFIEIHLVYEQGDYLEAPIPSSTGKRNSKLTTSR